MREDCPSLTLDFDGGIKHRVAVTVWQTVVGSSTVAAAPSPDLAAAKVTVSFGMLTGSQCWIKKNGLLQDWSANRALVCNRNASIGTGAHKHNGIDRPTAGVRAEHLNFDFITERGGNVRLRVGREWCCDDERGECAQKTEDGEMHGHGS